jgi:peptidoglycan/xylan/chitin deacetylase (PgdA/CDA1 family)
MRYFLLFFTLPLFSQPSLIFRLDDYVIGNGGMQDSIVELFVKLEIPLNVGIISYTNHVNSQKNILLKQLVPNGKIEVMMHGFAHLDNNINGKSKSKIGKSEFVGDSYESQFQRIKIGKNYLDSLFEKKVTVFSPPWNTYDKNTLHVIKDLGFTTISSDIAGKSFGIPLNYLPFTTEDFEIFNNQNKGNLKSYTDEDVIVVMFHPYTVGKAGMPDIKTLETLLKQLRKDEYKFYTYSGYLEKYKAGKLRLFINSRLRYNPILNKFQSSNTHGIYNKNSNLFWIFYLGLFLFFGFTLIVIFKHYRKIKSKFNYS